MLTVQRGKFYFKVAYNTHIYTERLPEQVSCLWFRFLLIELVKKNNGKTTKSCPGLAPPYFTKKCLRYFTHFLQDLKNTFRSQYIRAPWTLSKNSLFTIGSCFDGVIPETLCCPLFWSHLFFRFKLQLSYYSPALLHWMDRFIPSISLYEEVFT